MPSLDRPRAVVRLLAFVSLSMTGACARPACEPTTTSTTARATSESAAPSDRKVVPTVESKTDIVQTGAEVLRSRANEVPVAQIETPEFQSLIRTMIATMRKAPGVGLAAPQIGVPLRVIVLEDTEDLMNRLTASERRERERTAFPTRVFVNPVLTPIGDARAMFFEGCLSVSGFVGLVDRSLEVEVSGLDEHGVAQTWRVRGWPARILQHEVDHLDGTLYIDRMKTRSFATLDQAKARFAGKPIADVRKMLGL